MTDLAHLTIDRHGEVIIAAIEGEIDPSNARELGSELTAVVPNEAMAVVVDLTAVEYLDSSGVQLLFELAERLSARQQRMVVVVPPTSAARRVLEIVTLDVTAPVVDTQAEALERLEGARG